jgi:glutathione S-transferase-like protein
MVQLVDSDIKTREVLDWKGVHVLHFMGSSCSQKLRVFLNLKKIPWHSHPIDLPNNENMQPWFLGINPRGLVPVLVHDGAVHIESNDIIQYLEQKFPQPKLIPSGHESEVAKLLKHEDDLHLDLRTLSFRFVLRHLGHPNRSKRSRATPRTAPAPCKVSRIWKNRSRSSSGNALLRRASLTRKRGRQLKDFGSSSSNSTGHWQSSLAFWARP